ncbi:MAG: PKD domain-containing protein [Cytophagales bacterium]|nr:PKD domain-containing protein [Cytophagales bacterium]
MAVPSAFAACSDFNIPTTPQCAGGNCGAGTAFTSSLAEEPGKTYRYVWDFGDPNSGPANTSELKQPNHSYSQPGTYTVSVKVFVDGVEDPALGCSGTVTVGGVPDFKINVQNEDINLGPQEEEVCIEDLEAGVELSPVPSSEGGAAIPAGATFLWSNGATDAKITVDEEGCYSVTVSVTENGVTCARTNKVQVYGYKPEEDGPNAPPPQQQARWYFGNGAGVKFQGGLQAVSGGAVNTPEGSSTVLDRKGNLLFYTDGRTVFDTVGVALPNGTGLAGGPNSTQAVLIVPQPGCNSCDPVYYVFTTGDITTNGSRLEYNVVDMRLNPPKGGVDPTQKNQLLTESSTERVISIKGQSDPNVQNPVETTWIITHDFSGTFRIYPLTPAGLGAPKTYPGVAHSSPENGEGYMKSFPYTDPATGETKTRIAVVVPGAPGQPNKVEIFDFDPTTGAVSGPVTTVDLGEPDLKAYGVEFAGDYMYVSLTATPPDSSKIVRYDLNPPTGLTVENTREEIVSDPAKIGALQVGPDGAIYVAVQGATSLWSIAQPTGATAADVGLNRTAINLNGPTSNLGLPTNAEPENKGYGQSFSFEQPACAPAGTDYTIQFQANPDRAPRNDGQPNSTYLWTFHDGTTSTLQNPTKAYRSPGQYIVNLTITNDCRVEVLDPDTVFIYEAPPPIPPRSASACYGSPVRLEVYPGSAGPAGVRYTWILPNGTTRSGKTLDITAADAVPGLNVFRVVVANENCSETGIYQVNFTQPQVDLGPDVSDCEQTTIVLDAGNPGMQYQWKQNGTVLAETGRTLAVRPQPGTTTTYEVTVTDPLTRCTASDQVRIVRGAKPAVVVTADDATACAGVGSTGTLFINFDSPGPNVFSLINQADGVPIVSNETTSEQVRSFILPPGAYQVVVRNPAGCETTVLQSIGNESVDAPQIQFQPESPLELGCNETEGTVRALIILPGGGVPTSRVWKNEANETISEVGGNTIIQEPGFYTLTVTDGSGCTNSATFEIRANPNTVQVEVLDPIPTGCDQVQLRAVLNGTNPNPADYTFTWTIGGRTVAGAGLDAVTANRGEGDYSLVVSSNTEPACTAPAATGTITFPTVPNYEYGQNPPAACAGTPVFLDANRGEAFWDTYVWTLPGGATSTGSQVGAETSGVYKITVRNSATGCERTDEVTVTINQAPAAPVVNNPNVVACAGANLPGFTAAGTGLRWYSDAGLTQQVSTGNNTPTFLPTVDRNQPGAYTFYVTQTSAGGCQSLATPVTLTIGPGPQVDLGPDRNVCQGETVVLDATSRVQGEQATYRWENGLTTPRLNATRTGTYRVTVTLGTCVVRDSVTLTFVAPPETSVPRRTVPLCTDDATATATLDGGPGANFTYEWRKLGANAVLGTTRTITITSEARNLGRYIVSIGNGGACTRNDTIEVIKGCEPRVFVPDAFAPASNNDKNQKLLVFGQYVGKVRMLIYNRWGELIYAHEGEGLEALQSNAAWDGNYLGKPVPAGTYAWKITYWSTDFPGREPITLRGAVLLVR